ncbi:flagellar hook-basal body complex protein FliE [Thermosulfurimonas sp. F29]|uniref:flagellar hook-basal body complex protein FliE n=1 Tax=Thermosulfurimonas sp. F29 TaxID=2867247 RepID=UPI001C8395E7|nr:flagellar hook-basal body complex protein FliE [Thermosulfurimonas sp. F29]MBX6423058.1 flagellar hook-basal body complex protein FliE [Thermosulfurimonas sp. F29]
MKILPSSWSGLFPVETGKDVLKREKDFGRLLKEKLRETDRIQKQALAHLRDFASGRDTDLTKLTLSLAKADLSFRLVVRIRNKVLEAYQEIMRMQI